MDLILLAGRPRGPAPEGGREVIGSEGGRAVERFLAWQSEAGGRPDLYVVLPERAAPRDRLLELLAGDLGRRAGRVYVLIPPSRLEPEVVRGLEEAAPIHLLLTADPDPAASSAGLEVLGRHLEETVDSNLRLGVWAALASGGGAYRTLTPFLDAGVPTEVMALPAFAVDDDTGPSGTDVVAAPERFRKGLYFCQLYLHAVTVDRHGEVRTCPRAVGCGAELPLGNIFDHDPETLIRRKGEASHRIGVMELCTSCRQPGRFAWPERQTGAAEELFHDGLRRGRAMLRPAVSHRRPSQFDLSAEDEEGKRRALRRFAARLQAWSEEMDRWQRSRGAPP